MREHRLSAFGRNRLLVPASVFLLTCGLAACDLPGGATRQQVADDTMPASQESILALESASTSFDVGPAAMQPKAPAVPEPLSDELDFSEVAITPMEGLGNPDGNALLEVRFEDAKSLEDAIKIFTDEREFVLLRDAKDPTLFAGMIEFDFDRFTEEQIARKAEIEQIEREFKPEPAEPAPGGKNSFAGNTDLGPQRITSSLSNPVFTMRSVAGSMPLSIITKDEISTARARFTRIRIPPSSIAMHFSTVDPQRELLITDLSVVNDPTRTFDICGNAGNPNGAWTFKTLMTNMANQPLTGIDPSLFVENWIRTWTVNHTINTFPVPARSNIGPQVLNSWPRLPNGRLNLDRSPFRLLAIVNRVDLRSNTVYGGGSAGEGRFVFGVVNRNVNGGCSVTPFTVIFEYGVPVSGCSAVKNYAQQWVNLGNISLGSATFNPALQAITDQFTRANAAPRRGNGSALNQLRTNEIALANPWELREFVLPRTGVGQLGIVSTKQTPHHSRNGSAQLANYINVNTPQIIAGTHVVPQMWSGSAFLTGSTLNFSTANGAVWNAPGIANGDARHLFSLNTCGACHGGETRDNTPGSGDLQFVHIDARLPGAQSAISKFLRGNGTLAAPSTFPKPDPILGFPVRPFGDLRRRQIDLANLVNSSCRTTGLLRELRFRPMDTVPH
jgi:hypothetical protein